ncbi:MAG: hydrogenase maturation protease [Thermoanaerobaculia bacterium]
MTRRIAVFGIGNVLIGDDAVGPSIIRHLDAYYEFPPHVSVEDLGTPSLDLAGRMVGYHSVVFVDAVAAAGEPGELRKYSREEIVRHPPSIRLSPHDPSLKETILMMDLLSDGPEEILLIGVIPKSLEQFGLSDEARAAVPAAADAVLGELERLGVTPVRRATPKFLPAFWDAA